MRARILSSELARWSLLVVACVTPALAAHAAGEAACSLPTSSYSDSILNPPSGEDQDFFVTTGGVPNVVFLIDNSGSMQHLPPDGASLSWGSFENPSSTTAGGGFGCSNTVANSQVFNSACGTTTWDGYTYAAGNDYFNAKDASGNYCPYLAQAGQPMQTDKGGFDPDFQAYFAKDRVYHDNVQYAVSPADGWSDTGTNPETESTYSAFCSRSSFTAAQKTSCSTCMSTKGYWFDGTYSTAQSWAPEIPACGTTADCQKYNFGTCIKSGVEWNNASSKTGTCKMPNVWFVGNRLNFLPPKFLLARKVVKDVLASVKLYRLGVYIFDGTPGGDGLGAKALVGLNPTCNMFGSPSQFYNNRNSVMNAINNSSKLQFNLKTPLAEALLDIGHLYASQSLPWFSGTTYDRTSMEGGSGNQASICFSCQKSSVIVVTDGIPNRDSAIPGMSGATPVTQAIASTAGTYAGDSRYNVTTIDDATCQATCLKEGKSPADCHCETAAELADTTLAAGKCDGQQDSGSCDTNKNPITAYLPRVAWYLHNLDLKADTEKGYDGYFMTGKQSLDIYTIGLGTQGNASQILRHTAAVGGGLFNGGLEGDSVASAGALRDAIERSLDDVTTRSTNFGTASFSTLQAAASQIVLVPRFAPSKSAHWDGHLYAFDLWSEFTSGGCYIPTTGASGPANGDYDCDGKCTSVFLREKGTVTGGVYTPGSFISEDADGQYVVNRNPNRPLCGNGNLCAPADCSAPWTKGETATLATYHWDAGDKLSPLTRTGSAKTDPTTYTAWKDRKVYTVVDDTAPLGKLTDADTLVRVQDDDATVGSLLPYLNVVNNRKMCSKMASDLAAGNPTVATAITAGMAATPANWLPCAKVLVQYAMGADVFNERGCAGYPTTYCTRSYQLGDIFHSSPVEVWPPLASDGILCSRGLHSQCLPSLYTTSTPSPSTAGNQNAYDDYAKSTRYRHRNKFALVGANDGMVHAIVTGTWKAATDDPRTAADESQPPYQGYYEPSTGGKEIWAFIPPDLLPKLSFLLDTTHHYFVDGTAMVRDVWIDGGTPNKLSTLTSANDQKEASEFHTVAVMGERRGGTHYFALDVTDASDDLEAKPRFMWLYPQPSDVQQYRMGETYAEFVPTPPPIGPVRVDSGTTCAATAKFTNAAGTDRCFKEDWIVFLSGGFDPQYTKGRGVHMIQLSDGAEIFDFSQPTGSGGSCGDTSDPKCHLNYPVSGAVGMMMWGNQANFTQAAAESGFFDTATFGDAGGQLWVLRFSDPGIIDSSTGKVGNWFGARVFQHGKGTSTCGTQFCGSQPFFHITANVPLAANGLYRVLAGTGDRFNILDQAGGRCSPDNPRACIAKGCTVTLDDGSGGAGASYGSDYLGTQSYHWSLDPCSAGTCNTSSYSFSSTTGTSSCATGTSRINSLTITCPSTVACSGSAESTFKRIEATCTGGTCTTTFANPGYALDMKNLNDRVNWFFSVLVFSPSTTSDRKIFTTAAEAILYDKARLDESSLTAVNTYTSSTSAPAGASDGNGWKYFFDHGEPTGTAADQTVTIDGASYHIYRADERVASATAVEAGCTFWNTIQVAVPSGAFDDSTECPVTSPCKAGKKQVSYLYGAKPGTGELCLLSNSTMTRSIQSQALVPPHIGKLVAYVSTGQVSYGLTSVRPGSGGQNVSLGEAQDLSSQMGWLPIDPKLESCRHSPKDSPPTTCK